MSDGDNALIPRTGLPPRLAEGPKTGQRSLYHQQVLDEDTYTEALSNIITRDFFPNLPHIHATNAYLTALTNNDPELLSASIRRLAALAQDKEEGKVAGGSGSKDEQEAGHARRRELENVGTPYIAIPGGRAPLRTPVGARGWDTPVMRAGEGSTRRRPKKGEQDFDELEDDLGSTPGPSRPVKKRRPVAPPNRVRDDLTLDAFQRNYTSEDNAAFVQIVDEDNKRRREDRWSWAWEAEKRAEQRRIEGDDQKKMILEAATGGGWMVNGEGRRLIGGLGEGGQDRAVGEAWRDQPKLISAPIDEAPGHLDALLGTEVSIRAEDDLVQGTSSVTSTALIFASDATASRRDRPASELEERPIPLDHPLNKALVDAGLPATALVSVLDGAIVPQRDTASGSGEGRGRGDEEKQRRQQLQQVVLGDEEREHVPLGGSGADHWGFKARNNFYFPADANTQPYPKLRPVAAVPKDAAREAPPAITHANTRLPDDDEVGPASGTRSGSRRGSSPARSWVDAAVKGTPYRPGGLPMMPAVNNYSLLPNDPSPSPTELPSLLTWGTLMSTPRALDGNDDPLDLTHPAFKMPESKRRDELGRKLGDKASRSMNARAAGFTPRPNTALRKLAERTQVPARVGETPGKMLPPSNTPRREGLTPAAKRLLERSVARTPVAHSSKGALGISTGGKNRSAAMEKGSGWGGLGTKVGLGGTGCGKNELDAKSWTSIVVGQRTRRHSDSVSSTHC